MSCGPRPLHAGVRGAEPAAWLDGANIRACVCHVRVPACLPACPQQSVGAVPSKGSSAPWRQPRGPPHPRSHAAQVTAGRQQCLGPFPGHQGASPAGSLSVHAVGRAPGASAWLWRPCGQDCCLVGWLRPAGALKWLRPATQQVWPLLLPPSGSSHWGTRGPRGLGITCESAGCQQRGPGAVPTVQPLSPTGTRCR